MKREQILERMKLAIEQDRERFFKIADTLHLQPKYSEHRNELEVVKQQWRDITKSPDYPNITHPLSLPDWFPSVQFASRFKKDEYINEALAEEQLNEI